MRGMAGKEKPAPRVGSPSGDDGLFGRWHIGIPKYAFEYSNATTDDDIVRDVLHDRSSLTRHKGKQNWCLGEEI